MKTIQVIIVVLLLSGCGVTRQQYREEMTAMAQAMEAQVNLDGAIIVKLREYNQRILDLENKNAEYRQQQSVPYGPKTEIIPQ